MLCLCPCVCVNVSAKHSSKGAGGAGGLFELQEIASPVVGGSNCIHGVSYYIHEWQL